MSRRHENYDDRSPWGFPTQCCNTPKGKTMSRTSISLAVVLWAIVIGLILLLMSATANAQVKGDVEKFYPLPQYDAYLVSLTQETPFSKIVIGGNTSLENRAGNTVIFINGIPWTIPVYYPTQAEINAVVPWYPWPPRITPACQFEPWNCH